MRGSDRTRGAYGIITNKSLKKGSIDKYCYDLTYDLLEHLPSKEKNTYLCPKCAKIKNENLKLHEERQRVLEI